MTSFLIQYTLNNSKFISELIWLAAVCNLFTLEVVQKCQLWILCVLRKDSNK